MYHLCTCVFRAAYLSGVKTALRMEFRSIATGPMDNEPPAKVLRNRPSWFKLSTCAFKPGNRPDSACGKSWIAVKVKESSLEVRDVESWAICGASGIRRWGGWFVNLNIGLINDLKICLILVPTKDMVWHTISSGDAKIGRRWKWSIVPTPWIPLTRASIKIRL